MKRVLLSFVLLPFMLFVSWGQELAIKENFEENRFGWEEYAGKQISVSMQNGYLELICKKKGMVAISTTHFPIRYFDPFKVVFKFSVPVLNKDNRFGVLFNYEDGDNFSAFLLQEGVCGLYQRENGVTSRVFAENVKLKKGKDQPVTVELKKKGKKLIFTMNGMLVYEDKFPIKNSSFGVYTENSSRILVESVEVFQNPEGSD